MLRLSDRHYKLQFPFIKAIYQKRPTCQTCPTCPTCPNYPTCPTFSVCQTWSISPIYQTASLSIKKWMKAKRRNPKWTLTSSNKLFRYQKAFTQEKQPGSQRWHMSNKKLIANIPSWKGSISKLSGSKVKSVDFIYILISIKIKSKWTQDCTFKASDGRDMQIQHSNSAHLHASNSINITSTFSVYRGGPLQLYYEEQTRQ